MAAFEELRDERDALGYLGVLAHAFLTWDPPIAAGTDSFGKPDFTHYSGLNIHALIIDNTDGEVLAIARNQIHEHEDPTRHAEPAAIRGALARLRQKRPRDPGKSVESYYRTQLFYDLGPSAEDYVRTGCTLYSTLEPCPMCTATICVCRMKRTVFAIQDKKFGGSWSGIKARYPDYNLAYGPFAAAGESPAAVHAKRIAAEIAQQVDGMRERKLQDTWFVDYLHDSLRAALEALTELQPASIAAPGEDRASNTRTLLDLKRLCRLPA